MQSKLKSVASVQMGYSFRSRLDPSPQGNVSVIQMKDLTEDNRLDSQELVTIDMEDLSDKHRVRFHDIAFRSRGMTNTAALIDCDLDNAVIAAPLLRVRVQQREKVDPAYLCWFINQPASQAILRSQATGTAARMIGKPALENLEIALPPMAIQMKIATLERLALAEQKLLQALAKKRHKITEGAMMQMIMESQDK